MTGDSGRYLTNMEGLTHEVFGGDPDEIVLRVARVGEGAGTLDELARELHEEARRYERLGAGGWRMVEPFRAGEARCRKTAEPGASAPPAPDAGQIPPPAQLQAAVEGAEDLPVAAARLRAAAAAYERRAADGGRLADPVVAGRVPLA
ncbi:MAG: hypothetical protein WD250_08400 [Egibacteraceae bacterium]